MNQLSDGFEYAISKFGMPVLGEKASSQLLDSYRGRIPETLIDFWQVAGFGVWLDGYFQFCNPDRYQPVLDLIFEGDKDIKPERSHLIGFSAFGHLLVWNEDLRVVDVDSIYHLVACSYFFKPKPEIKAYISLETAVSGIDDEANDPPDQDGRDMYKRVRKAHGPLKYGQIYAPKLHPALGGPVTVDNFRPASALEALALSAQAGPFTLRDATKFPVRDVRQIG
jgi:hypothetical protein